jgi:hypothetical protein
VVGRKADDYALEKKITVAKSKEVKPDGLIHDTQPGTDKYGRIF